MVKFQIHNFRCLHFFAGISLTMAAPTSFTAQAASQPLRNGQSGAINLTCSGSVSDWTKAVTDVPVSGVYVEIDGDTVSLYNVPTFPDYQTGMSFDVYSKNPSKIWARNRIQASISLAINRMSGEISVQEMSPKGERMLRHFQGKCTNQKPVF